jgi:transposase
VQLIDPELSHLPEDAASLKAMVMSLVEERKNESLRAEEQQCKANEQERRADALKLHADDLHIRLLRMEVELARYRKWYYGPRADRLESVGDVAQMLLNFGEELDRKPINPGAVSADVKSEEKERRVRRRKGRRHLERFENLPVTTHMYELNEAERACPCCGKQRKEIGADESWQIEYVPGRFERIQHVRKKYACAACDASGDGARVASAARPASAIDKGLAGPGLLSYIVTSKFADYLPLYHLEDIFERQGFEISRSTQSIWCGDTADLIEPLYHLMADRTRMSHLVATDDTTFPMQAKDKVANARMWVYVGDDQHPYNIFDFTLDRGRDGPMSFLANYSGVMLADGYAGYNGVVAGNQITRAGCWAHLKRKFVDAEKAEPEIAREAVERVRALYSVERQAKDVATEKRLAVRRDQSAPLVAEFRQRLLVWKEHLLPKHPMAEAINYALGQWNELTVFLADPAVPIDNNVSEREMKRIVLNRKNSLFVGNPRGGRTAAILSSLTSTCRRHSIDPQLYFTQLLTNLPATPTNELAAWLPDQWKLRHTKALVSLQAASPKTK